MGMDLAEFAKLSTENERGLKDTIKSVVGAVAITSALFIPPAIILKEAADTAANSIHINTEPTSVPLTEKHHQPKVQTKHHQLLEAFCKLSSTILVVNLTKQFNAHHKYRIRPPCVRGTH